MKAATKIQIMRENGTWGKRRTSENAQPASSDNAQPVEIPIDADLHNASSADATAEKPRKKRGRPPKNRG